MAEMSPLRRRMIEDMTVRNLSPATQRSYVHAVAKFKGIDKAQAIGVLIEGAANSDPFPRQACSLGWAVRSRTVFVSLRCRHLGHVEETPTWRLAMSCVAPRLSAY